MKKSENKTTEPNKAPEKTKTSESIEKTKTAPKADSSAKVNNESADDQDTKFTLVMKQVWNVIKGLFSKDAVRTVASQYDEDTPIWLVLMPLYVLLFAASQLATFKATKSASALFDGLISTSSFGDGEVFFVAIGLSIIYVLAFTFGIRAFIKFHKGDGHFSNSANLLASALLPITVLLFFNVITAGFMSFIFNPLINLANIAMYMMVFSGISAKIDGKKPIWSFFLMIIAVAVVTVVVGVLVLSPIIFSNIANSLIDKLNQAGLNN